MPTTKSKFVVADYADHTDAELQQAVKDKELTKVQLDEVRAYKRKAADDLAAAQQTGKPQGPVTNGKPAKDGKTCPVSLEQVMATMPQAVKIGDAAAVYAEPKHFSTGSYGYFFNGKVTLLVDGVPTAFQIGMNITAVNSKPKQ